METKGTIVRRFALVLPLFIVVTAALVNSVIAPYPGEEYTNRPLTDEELHQLLNEYGYYGLQQVPLYTNDQSNTISSATTGI